MVYPAQSDFRSATPGSAWYLRQVGIQGLQNTVCGSTGWAILAAVQDAVRTRLQESGPLPSYRGTVADSDVPTTGFDPASGAPSGPGWDEGLLRAVYAVAQRDGLRQSGAPYLSSVAVDAQAAGQGVRQTISPRTLATALWVAFYNAGTSTQSGQTQNVYGLGSPSEIIIPAGANLPVLNERPPVPPADYATSSVCGPVPQAAGTQSGLGWWLLGGVLLAGTGYLLLKGGK